MKKYKTKIDYRKRFVYLDFKLRFELGCDATKWEICEITWWRNFDKVEIIKDRANHEKI